MMNLPTALLMAILVTVVSSAKQANIMNVQEWENYKSRFNKSYSRSEDSERMNIYWKNRRTIDNLNELYRFGKIHFNVTDNEFADMRAAELPWESKGCLKINELNLALAKFWKTNDPNIFETSRNLPKDVDWVARGAVNPVKNQHDCGSCYAFATISALESRYFIKYNKLLDLSEQNMIDCSHKYGNQGCLGGYLDNAYEYLINYGANEQDVYPYENREGSCRFKKNKVAATMRKFRVFTTEKSLKRAVAKGPVAVGIDTHHDSFKYYSSGIYKDSKCGSYGANHAVTVVGYGTDPDTDEDYWLIRNSWGPGWGEKGYMKLLRGVQMCNIGLIAAAPIV